MAFSREKLFTGVRVAFGFVWLIDAAFKWTPAFLNGLPGMLSDMMTGQPAWIADWIGFWLHIIQINPFAAAIGVAVIESVIGLSLVFGIFVREILWLGAVFSLLLWSVGEGFGGPYAAGSTDIGTAIIYAFVFVLLIIKRMKSKHVNNAHEPAEKIKSPAGSSPLRAAILVIIFLIAILVTPYFVAPSQQSSGMQMSDMPPGMMLKEFDIPAGTPAPTIDLVITKDAFDGYDIHILTTNFTFTPENINQAPVLDQGHVHLYVDGALSVVFGPWYHIGDLAPGIHTISASLNANDHSVFTAAGKHIDVTKTITAY